MLQEETRVGGRRFHGRFRLVAAGSGARFFWEGMEERSTLNLQVRLDKGGRLARDMMLKCKGAKAQRAGMLNAGLTGAWASRPLSTGILPGDGSFRVASFAFRVQQATRNAAKRAFRPAHAAS